MNSQQNPKRTNPIIYILIFIAGLILGLFLRSLFI